jgi:maleate cis-trans isomerase
MPGLVPGIHVLFSLCFKDVDGRNKSGHDGVDGKALSSIDMSLSSVEKTQRFGLLTPSSNTVQEPEFSAALPAAVSLHTARVAYREITPQEQMRCVRELESECRKLADAEVDVVVFAATAPTLANGKGYDRELIKRMEDAAGRPATTAATAFVDALTRLGAKSIAIGAPWSKTMDRPMIEFMRASGFEVVHSEVVGFVASIELGRVGPEGAYALGRRTDRPGADAIVMPGGNWPAMSVVERLEAELGKPVLANNAVSLWAALRLLKRRDSIPGYGQLLREGLADKTTTACPSVGW